jgi:D-arabinose 1-dehydrogenase-like Zn-dependent alcohol dehydrogenase
MENSFNKDFKITEENVEQFMDLYNSEGIDAEYFYSNFKEEDIKELIENLKKSNVKWRG